jgi:hypothetical protein
MVPMAPAAATCDIHADARSAIAVAIAPAVAAPALPDIDARTHTHVRPTANVRRCANNRCAAAAALDHGTLAAATRLLDGRTATSAASSSSAAARLLLDGRATRPTATPTTTAAAPLAASSAVTPFTLALGMWGRPLRQHDAGLGPVARNCRAGRRGQLRRRPRRECQSQHARAGDI